MLDRQQATRRQDPMWIFKSPMWIFNDKINLRYVALRLTWALRRVGRDLQDQEAGVATVEEAQPVAPLLHLEHRPGVAVDHHGVAERPRGRAGFHSVLGQDSNVSRNWL